MTRDEEIVLCSKAIKHYTPARQIVQAMEELGELQQALARHLNCRDNNVEEEIADVEIMLTQLMIIFDLKKIENFKNYKLQRLEGRINGHEC